MKVRATFLRLPLRFDAARLEAEVASLPAELWQMPSENVGRVGVLPLVAFGGLVNGGVDGPMAPTPHLDRLPYVNQVVASLGAVIGRTHLVRVPRAAEAPARVERSHYLETRARVHVPIVTRPEVRFHCGPDQIHMPAGSCFLFDTTLPQRVQNESDVPRVHLVIDTVGSRYFWELVDRAHAPSPAEASADEVERGRLVAYRPGEAPDFPTEAGRVPGILTPWEIATLARVVIDDIATPDRKSEIVAKEAKAQLTAFEREWVALFGRYGGGDEHRSAYQRVIEELVRSLHASAPKLLLTSGMPLLDAVRQLIVEPALARSSTAGVASAAPAAIARPVVGGPAPATPAPRAGAAAGAPPAARAGASVPAARGNAGPPRPTAEQLRSVHTQNLPDTFRKLGISLLVSTYQSGHLIAIRADGDKLNTHFRTFRSPMGIALGANGFALGTHDCLWVYRNQPSVAPRIQPQKPYDACFLPQACHVTGDIRIHDVAYGKQDLWVVNTKFSCLSTLDRHHSFVPRWRPPFVSALAPEDRCHLNGLAMVDGEPRYVTALGTTDTAGGWRADRAHGGVILEVPSGRVVARGLSMPHSPRMYRGKLYVLESGDGSIATVDVATGEVTTIVRLPGFTRGLSFVGPLAFIGLSQVRETNIFGGIPLTERIKERVCGIWVVDIETGAVVGFLRFEGQVQEIFDVQVLRAQMPEIVELGSELAATAFVLPPHAMNGARQPA